MSSASRGARAAARSVRQSTRVQTRRYASHSESHGHDAHGHGSSAYHVSGGEASGSEGFGRGFYITIAAIPTFWLSYQIATNPNNVVRRFVDGYTGVKDSVEGKNHTLHDAAIEQAISDRLLLKGAAKSDMGPPLRYPEQLNAGSPLNVVAGEGTTDLSALIKHYEETERKRVENARAAR